MKNTIRQELIDWTWHNCVPEHRAYDMPKNSVFCAECMVAFVRADRQKRRPNHAIHSDGEGRCHCPPAWQDENGVCQLCRD